MFERHIGDHPTDALKLGRLGIPKQRKSLMLRHARLVMIVLTAMFIVAVPTAVAQDPLGDQYSTPVADGGAGAADEGAGAGTGAGADTGAAVQVRELSKAQSDDLPFTGGQISLIALIGLGLLAAGAVGIASTRRRTSATTT